MGRDTERMRSNRPGLSGLRNALFGVVLVLLAASAAVGAQTAPQVRQPNDASWSLEARTALTKGLSNLAATLGQPGWASGRTYSSAGWGMREFSIYTAGVLSERGYSVTIVGSDSSANARVWLLVGLPVPGGLAWVPVEPSPSPGYAQTVLGRVPMSGDAFAAAYVTYAATVAIPPNATPTARIRPPSTRVYPNQVAELLAFGSSDPDGSIVVYRWEFGDGTWAVFYDYNAAHTFAAAAAYTVTLTVIDNGGRSGVATFVLAVGSDAPLSTEHEKPDCGCGK